MLAFFMATNSRAILSFTTVLTHAPVVSIISTAVLQPALE